MGCCGTLTKLRLTNTNYNTTVYADLTDADTRDTVVTELTSVLSDSEEDVSLRVRVTPDLTDLRDMCERTEITESPSVESLTRVSRLTRVVYV